MNARPPFAFGLLLLSLALFGVTCARPVPPPDLPALPIATEMPPVSYREQVEPILESRCAVCHGCYDAPCQLQFTSYEGLTRGATKQGVYHSERLTPTEPTRLLIDAQSTEAWRERGFFPVLEGTGSASPDALLLSMLALGNAHPFRPDAKLPDSVPLDITRTLSCPTVEEFGKYAQDQPLGGMPYGMAPLSQADLAHRGFSRLLLPVRHPETLLGVFDPVKCLLAYGSRRSDFC